MRYLWHYEPPAMAVMPASLAKYSRHRPRTRQLNELSASNSSFDQSGERGASLGPPGSCCWYWRMRPGQHPVLVVGQRKAESLPAFAADMREMAIKPATVRKFR